MYCEYCDREYKHFKSHIKRKKHLNNRRKNLDENLQFMPKVIVNMIFEYSYDISEDLNLIQKQKLLLQEYNPQITSIPFYQKIVNALLECCGIIRSF